MNYSKSFSQTTSFSSVNGKTSSKKNTYMIEQSGKQARFLKQVGDGEKHRSLAGYTPDGKKMAMLSQKINGGKVKYNKYIVENPRNLRAVITNSLNLTDLEKQLRKKKIMKHKGKRTNRKTKSTKSKYTKSESTKSKYTKSKYTKSKYTKSESIKTKSGKKKSGRKPKKNRVAKKTRSIRKPKKKKTQRKSK